MQLNTLENKAIFNRPVDELARTLKYALERNFGPENTVITTNLSDPFNIHVRLAGIYANGTANLIEAENQQNLTVTRGISDNDKNLMFQFYGAAITQEEMIMIGEYLSDRNVRALAVGAGCTSMIVEKTYAPLVISGWAAAQPFAGKNGSPAEDLHPSA